MPDFEVGRWPYAQRHRIMDAVADACYRYPSPTTNDGSVVVVIRVTAPPIEDEVRDELYFTEIAPDAARGCATKVMP